MPEIELTLNNKMPSAAKVKEILAQETLTTDEFAKIAAYLQVADEQINIFKRLFQEKLNSLSFETVKTEKSLAEGAKSTTVTIDTSVLAGSTNAEMQNINKASVEFLNKEKTTVTINKDVILSEEHRDDAVTHGIVKVTYMLNRSQILKNDKTGTNPDYVVVTKQTKNWVDVKTDLVRQQPVADVQ